jgi:pyridoxal biosynthesis lyase PdxS
MSKITIEKKNPTRMKQVLVRLTEKEYQYIKKISRETGKSMSGVAHEFLSETIAVSYEYGYNGKPGSGKSFYQTKT